MIAYLTDPLFSSESENRQPVFDNLHQYPNIRLISPYVDIILHQWRLWLFKSVYGECILGQILHSSEDISNAGITSRLSIDMGETPQCVICNRADIMILVCYISLESSHFSLSSDVAFLTYIAEHQYLNNHFLCNAYSSHFLFKGSMSQILYLRFCPYFVITIV